jgi:hypothetical protein
MDSANLFIVMIRTGPMPYNRKERERIKIVKMIIREKRENILQNLLDYYCNSNSGEYVLF